MTKTTCRHQQDCDYPDCYTRSFPEIKKCSDTTCLYPVIAGMGQCCGDTECSVRWLRPCDEMGGCIDRSTCGDCSQPVFKGDANYDKAA